MHSNKSLPFAAASGSSAVAVETRQEGRLHIAVPVKVFPDTKALESQTCCTYEISMAGARLASLPGIKTVGQVICLQRQSRRAKYKVIWIGEPGTQLEGQVGVESLEPTNVIWENEIKSRIIQSR